MRTFTRRHFPTAFCVNEADISQASSAFSLTVCIYYRAMASPSEFVEQLRSLDDESDRADRELSRLVEDISRTLHKINSRQVSIFKTVLTSFTNSWNYVLHSTNTSVGMAFVPWAVAAIASACMVTLLYKLLWEAVDVHDLVGHKNMRWSRLLLWFNRYRPLKRRINLDRRDDRGRTALHASVGRSTALTKALLSAGADPNIRDLNGNIPLHFAMKAGSGPKGVSSVAESSAGEVAGVPADIGQLASSLHSLQQAASDAMHKAMGDTSLDADGAVSASDGASSYLDLEPASSARSSVTARISRWLNTARAAWASTWPWAPPAVVQREVVSLLLSSGCDPCARNFKGQSVLHVAASEPREDAGLLASIDMLGKAIAVGRVQAAGSTVAAGSSSWGSGSGSPPSAPAPAAATPSSSTPAQGTSAPAPASSGSTSAGVAAAAAASPSAAGAEDALWGALSVGDGMGATPLHFVSRPAVARALLARLSPATAAALVNIADYHGVTPLLAACRDGRSRVGGALLDAGADHSAADPQSRYTPAHAAAACVRMGGACAAEALRALAAAGADMAASLPEPPDCSWYTWGTTDPVAYAGARDTVIAATAHAPPPGSTAGPPPASNPAASGFPLPGAPRPHPPLRLVGCTPFTVAAATHPAHSLTTALATLVRGVPGAPGGGINVNDRDEHGATPAGVAHLHAESTWHGHTTGRLCGMRVDRLQNQLHMAAATDDGDAITRWMTRPQEMLLALIDSEKEVQEAAAGGGGGTATLGAPAGTMASCPVSGRSMGGGASVSGCPFASRMGALAAAKEAERAAIIAAAMAAPGGEPASASSSSSPGSSGRSAASTDDPSSAPHSAPASTSSSTEGEVPVEEGLRATAGATTTTTTTTTSTKPTRQPGPMASASLLRSVCMAAAPRDLTALLRGVDPVVMAGALDFRGMTPLHLAVWLGHVTAVGALLEGKADVDARGCGPLQLPPLGCAFLRFATHAADLDGEGHPAYERLLGCATLLLQAGASVSRCLVGRHPPRTLASHTSVELPPHIHLWREHPSFLRALLAAAARDVAAVDEHGNTLLHVLLYGGLVKTAASAVRALVVRVGEGDPDDDPDDDVEVAEMAEAEGGTEGSHAGGGGHPLLRAFLCGRNSVGHSVIAMMRHSGVPALEELARSAASLRALSTGAAYRRTFPLHAAAAIGDVGALAKALASTALQLTEVRRGLIRLREAMAGLRGAHNNSSPPAPSTGTGTGGGSASASPAAAASKQGGKCKGKGKGKEGAADSSGTPSSPPLPAPVVGGSTSSAPPPPAASCDESFLRDRVAAINNTRVSLLRRQQQLASSLEAHDDRGLTPLGAACVHGQVDAARLLVTGELELEQEQEQEGKAGAEADAAPAREPTCSKPAAPHPRLPTASVEGRCAVYSRGLLLSVRPLSLAASHGFASVVQLLLDCGASPTAPVDLAVPDRACYRVHPGSCEGLTASPPGGASGSYSGEGDASPGTTGTTSHKGGKGKGKGKGKNGSPSDLLASAPASESPATAHVAAATVPGGTYVKAQGDALSAAALSGHADALRVLLSHPAVTADMGEDGACGSLASSIGWAAAYAAREGHAEVSALLLPLAAAEPGAFVFPSNVPGRGFRVSPASFAAPGPVMQAVAAALGSTTPPTAHGGASASSSSESSASGAGSPTPPPPPPPPPLTTTTTLALRPAAAQWVAIHAHRALLGYAIVDDDPARVTAWVAASPGLRERMDAGGDGHTLATAIRVGAPRVAAALVGAFGAALTRSAHMQLILVTGCDVRKLTAIGSVKQVAALLIAGGIRLDSPFLPAAPTSSGKATKATGLWGRFRLPSSFSSAPSTRPSKKQQQRDAPPAPWELTEADVARVRKVLPSPGVSGHPSRGSFLPSSCVPRCGRSNPAGSGAPQLLHRLGSTVVLPFSSSLERELMSAGQSGATPLPGMPTCLTVGDRWAYGCGLTVDEFDYLTDLHLGLQPVGVLPKLGGNYSQGPAAGNGTDGPSSDASGMTGGGARSDALARGPLSGSSVGGFNPLAFLTGDGGEPEGRLAHFAVDRPTTSLDDEWDRREVDALGRVVWYKPVDVADLAIEQLDLTEEWEQAQKERKGKDKAAEGKGSAAAEPRADASEPSDASKAAAAALAAAADAADKPASSESASGAPSSSGGMPSAVYRLTFGDVLRKRCMLKAVLAELMAAGYQL